MITSSYDESLSSDVMFGKLSKNLSALFSFVENSQEELSKIVEKLRITKQSNLLDDMEELIDGTFDELTCKHKELRKLVGQLRLQCCSQVAENSRSVAPLQLTTNCHVAAATSMSKKTIFCNGVSNSVTVGPSTSLATPTEMTNSPDINMSCSSLNDRLMIDESKEKAFTDHSFQSCQPVKEEVLSNEVSGLLSHIRRPTVNAVGCGLEDVKFNRDNRTLADFDTDSFTADMAFTSVSVNIFEHSTFADGGTETSVATVDDTVVNNTSMNTDSEMLARCGFPLNVVVEVKSFNTDTLVQAFSEKFKRRGQQHSDAASLSRLVSGARRLINKTAPARARVIAEQENKELDGDSDASGMDEPSRPKRIKTLKVEARAKGTKMTGNSDGEATPTAVHRLTRSRVAEAAVVVVSDDDDTSGNISESSVEVLGGKTVDCKPKVDLSNGREEVAILSDNGENNESDDDESVARRPVTRSRMKDEGDSLLRKKVTLLDDSDLDDDEDYKVVERVHKKASKAIITRKRVYSSSSSLEDAVVLDQSDVDSGRSDAMSNSDTKQSKKSQHGSKTVKDEKKSKAVKKKRKIACDSDDEHSLLGSASEAENCDDSSKFRNRKMISKAKLTKTTIDAEKAEKERRKRLQEKQKLFNGIEIVQHDESGEVEFNLTDKSKQASQLMSLILDKDEKSDSPQPVEVHHSIVKMLKPHQAEGLVFMYNSLFESIERLDSDESFGGILAHCMGLGKTFQVIAFLHTIMSHPKLSKVVKHTMIVGPKNVVNNWAKEFKKWLYDVDPELDTIVVYNLALYTSNKERKEVLREWHKSKKPSVMIISYELFRILTESEDDKPKVKNNKKPKKKSARERKLEAMKEDFRKYLQDPGPDLVVCDEGHKLKSDETTVFKTMLKIRTSRRLCLTGTPMQNNLSEYYTMISFVKPGLLGTKSEFANRFSNIISRGQTTDATQLEVRAMKHRCHVLFDYLREVVQRRDYRVLVETIPPKQEYVIYVRLTPRQCELYRGFLMKYCEGAQLTLRKRLLPDYHIFARIWTHPFALVLHERDAERRRILDGDDFVVSDEEEEEEAEMTPDDDDSDVIASDQPSTSAASKGFRRQTRQNPGAGVVAEVEDEEVMSGWYSSLNLISKNDEFDFKLGNKLIILQQIIKKCEEIGDKLLVFSQSLESLRMIRRMLEYLDNERLWFVDGHEALRAEGEEWGWVNGVDYLIIDGSVSSKSRDYIQDQFNDPLNLRARLMLISTLAGSLGTNLVTANRVVIFDACWNPSHDTQAMFRVYRYGQNKPVYIYRLIAQGTMEERIYKRQVTKESTARRVTEEAQIQRHFRGSDLYELYEFTPDMTEHVVHCPQDLLLADVVNTHKSAVVEILQHDSLFDEVEEKLSESERLAAWEDYEHEKRAPVYASTVPNGTMQPIQPDLPADVALLPNNSTGFTVTIGVSSRTRKPKQPIVSSAVNDVVVPNFNVTAPVPDYHALLNNIKAKLAVVAPQKIPYLGPRGIIRRSSINNPEVMRAPIDYIMSNAPMHMPTLKSYASCTPPECISELMGVTTGARTDLIYRSCFFLPGMTNDVAIRVLFIKRLLDRLMIYIPHDLRGGLNDFDSYFINTIKNYAGNNQSPVQLLQYAIKTFRTTVGVVNNIPKCMQMILNFKRLAPALFPEPSLSS